MQVVRPASWPSTSATRRKRLAVVLTLIGLIAVAAWAWWGDTPLIMAIRAQGKTRYVPAGVELGDALHLLNLRPRAGDLLDVEGGVIEAAHYRGRVKVNGAVTAMGTEIEAGAVVQVLHGKDHREPIRRRTVKIRGGEATNPQFVIGTAPGVAIVREGAISKKIVSSVFRPTGDVRVPRAVALTFDDGPWPTSTRRVLAVLRRFKAKATFFVVGYLAERYPGLVREEIKAGMSVANHSWGHPYSPPFKDLSSKAIRREIARTSTLLSDLGYTSRLFRPPGGSQSPRVVEIARRLGHRVVLWSVDPNDWATGDTAASIRASVLAAVGPGSIVLLHDGGGDQTATVQALPGIIKGIRAKGLKLVALE